MLIAKNIGKPGGEASFRARDMTGVAWTLLLFAVVFIVVSLFNTDAARSVARDRTWSPSFVLPANVLLFVVAARLKAIWSGVELNPQMRTITFAGGGVSANNLIDFFRPTFLLQYLGRTRIHLDEIQQISVDEVRKQRGNATGGISTDSTFYLRLAGTFGAASIKFLNKGKCDAVFAAIRQNNRMGEPIFAA